MKNKERRAGRVIGIGACTFDILFRTEEMPRSSETILADAFSMQLGGPAVVTLCGLSKLGIETEFLGKIGDDHFVSDQLVAWMKENRIETDRLRRHTNGLSRVVLVLVDRRSGSRSFVFRPDSFELTADDPILEFPLECGLLVIDEANPLALRAAQNVKESGVEVFYCGGWYRGDMECLFQNIDFFVVSTEFFASWDRLDDTTHDLPMLFSKGSFAFGIITMGEDGCIVISNDSTFHFPAFEVEVVDTTGAGDAFCAGVAFAYMHRWPLLDLVRFASACAALNCMSLGGSAGLPTLDEVEEFLEKSSA